MSFNPLVPQAPVTAVSDSFRLGTVTQLAPLRVKLDGDSAATEADPINTFGPVVVGDRVWCQIHGKALLIVGSVNAAERDLYMRNFGRLINGGGLRVATTAGVSWSQRLIGLGAGRKLGMAPDGYWEMTMPPDGTVIPMIGHNTTTSVTVSGVVPLGWWQVLWYDPPVGASRATDPSRYRITSYNQPFDVPPTWVPLVWKNGDHNSYTWADGNETAPWTTPTLTSPWINFGSGYAPARYKRENGRVTVEGLVRNGAINGTIFNLPAGYRPEQTLIFLGHANGGIADVRVSGAGNIWVAGYFAGGTNGDVSLSQIAFSAAL